MATNPVLILSQSRKSPLQFTIYPPDIVTPGNTNRYEAVARHLHSCAILYRKRMSRFRPPPIPAINFPYKHDYIEVLYGGNAMVPTAETC